MNLQLAIPQLFYVVIVRILPGFLLLLCSGHASLGQVSNPDSPLTGCQSS